MADTSEFDTQLAELDTQLGELLKAMDKSYQAFEAATSAWIVDRFESRVAYAIKQEKPERARELGPDGLAKVRAALNALKGKAAAEATSELAPLPWPHTYTPKNEARENEWENPWQVLRRSLPDNVARALSRAYRPVVDLLGEYELTDARPIVRVGHLQTELQPSDEMMTALTEYGDSHGKWKRAVSARAKVENEKAQFEASDIWENL